MGKPRFTEEFKIDAIKQITERCYFVTDVSKRLGVSTHSLYGWIKRYSTPPNSDAKNDQSAEIRRLKHDHCNCLPNTPDQRELLSPSAQIELGA